MPDPIAEILRKLHADTRIQQTRFTPTFLNQAGLVFERHGFGTAKDFLLDKAERYDLREQANVLLEAVLPVLESCEQVRQRRALGRMIIKTLNAIKAREV
jgi:hypothetical protein